MAYNVFFVEYHTFLPLCILRFFYRHLGAFLCRMKRCFPARFLTQIYFPVVSKNCTKLPSYWHLSKSIMCPKLFYTHVHFNIVFNRLSRPTISLWICTLLYLIIAEMCTRIFLTLNSVSICLRRCFSPVVPQGDSFRKAQFYAATISTVNTSSSCSLRLMFRSP